MWIDGTRRTAIGVVALAALVVSGCGGSDGGGDIEAFCEQIRALDAGSDAADEDLTAAADEFEALIGDAPDEVEEDLRVVVDAFTELDAIDEDDPESFELVFELFQRPEFVEATQNLEQFGIDECGLEATSDDGDVSGEDVSGDDGEFESGDDLEFDDGDVKTTTVPGDPYDEAFWGPIDPGEISIPGLEQHLDVNYSEENWFGGSLNGSSLGAGEVTVFALVEVDEAVRMCDALVEYAGAIEPDTEVIVEDNDGASQLASGTLADGCAPADGPGSAL